jgi:hypothetical protein
MWFMPRYYKQDSLKQRVSERVPGTGQGEARHRKCKRLKLDGGQAYDRSNN